MRTALLAVLLLISLACSSQAQQSGDVAARVGDAPITVKELDERWQKEEPAQKAQAEQAIYDGRKTALDAIIADMLVEQAAKAKGRLLTPTCRRG
jgi:parvulin-like peptidyl-prolyl isomerase